MILRALYSIFIILILHIFYTNVLFLIHTISSSKNITIVHIIEICNRADYILCMLGFNRIVFNRNPILNYIQLYVRLLRKGYLYICLWFVFIVRVTIRFQIRRGILYSIWHESNLERWLTMRLIYLKDARKGFNSGLLNHYVVRLVLFEA